MRYADFTVFYHCHLVHIAYVSVNSWSSGSPACRRALPQQDHLLWIWVLEWDGEGAGGRGGCINYRNGHTLGCYKWSTCVTKGFSTRLHVSSHWMGNFQFSGLARFMESLWSYSLFSVSAVYFCFLFFWPACLMFMKHAVSFIWNKVVCCVILAKFHPTCFIVHCLRLQYCLHM